MSSGDGKQMVENTPRVDVAKVLAETPKADEPKRIPAGCVERVLNFRDRNLLIGALREFCSKEGKGDHKAQSKVNRMMKLLSFQETVDYFEMIEDALEDETFKWQHLRNNWLSWQQYMNGGLTHEDLKRKAPSVDISDPPKKPAKKQPESTREELRGKERAFHLPSKLDAWVQDCLKVATWNPLGAEYVTELCEKFGLKSDED